MSEQRLNSSSFAEFTRRSAAIPANADQVPADVETVVIDSALPKVKEQGHKPTSRRVKRNRLIAAGLVAAAVGTAAITYEPMRILGIGCKPEEKGHLVKPGETLSKIINENHPNYNYLQRRGATNCTVKYNSGINSANELPTNKRIDIYRIR